MGGLGVGGDWDPNFKSQLQTFKPKSQAEISISGGGGSGVILPLLPCQLRLSSG